MKHVTVHQLVQFFKNNILQGSVATPFRCGGKFNDSIVANFLLSNENYFPTNHTKTKTESSEKRQM